MIRLLLLLAFLLAPAAAAAGTRATFSGRFNPPTTILIADNGDFDAELRPGRRLVVRDGRAFIVEERLTGPIVTPLDVLEALAAERVAGVNRQQPEWPALVQRDEVTVNGRIGRGYYFPARNGQPERLIAVISKDPALASLGRVMRRAFAADAVLAQATSENPQPRGTNSFLDRIFAEGTPIQLDWTRLRDVAQVAIPSVTLPAEPETGAALRARLAAEAAERDAPSPPEWLASRAVFAGGRLYLLAGNQRLISLAEGETSLTRHDPGGHVIDICVQRGDLLALTGGGTAARAWTLRRLRAGQWRTERTIDHDDERVVALSCTMEGMFLLTSRRFLDLSHPHIAVLRLRGDPIRTLVTTVVHVTPRAVFVGLNAGEWGGGLRRIDRRSGQIETIERNNAGGLCEGPLNTACDPVQGLATIPWRPDCVAAAIGLIHMMSHGRLATICADRVEQLYAATDYVFDDAEQAREAAQGGYGSIAFFGLAATGNSLLAIGHNGLHRLAADGTATHIPLPRFTRVEGLLVSFALPDVVLVVTGINGRASLSGAVPIMAVR